VSTLLLGGGMFFAGALCDLGEDGWGRARAVYASGAFFYTLHLLYFLLGWAYTGPLVVMIVSVITTEFVRWTTLFIPLLVAFAFPLYILSTFPTTTNARCVLAGGFEMRPAMCTPDFGPMFDYGVTAFAALGNVLDNFLDMAYLIVVYGPDTPCPTSQSNAVNLDWALDPLALSLFGTNTTVLITLGASSWALTDGQHALFVRSSTTVRRSYFPNIWGNFPVNPRQALFLFCCGWPGR
jgi:hypothetical protein